ncbi:MAG: His/Gly/Thr/Pro-type tRNA ligase C-terminal domain-containing protein [Candidatus Pacebacteria bacterium]|nr:His/Gly/Thr/Pro-type tRNA ligase C-terminal domain-containing protein [Candidatus Paceibacterota bacterium]
MKQSQIFTKTQKENPKDEKSLNAILLQRAGFIYKEMAGVYSYLPMGLMVLNKISNIVREEMQNIGGQEVNMAILQPKALWQKTDRWDKGIGLEVMYKVKDEQMEVGLGPTHEEMLTDIIKNHIESFEDLPFSAFQIQTKFRKEARAKSGLLRGREFLMKDLYSFHASTEDFKDFYEKTKQAYLKVFEKCGLKAIITEASGGGFSKDYSHEFQIISPAGEDTIYYCDVPALSLSKGHFSQNEEIFDKKITKCPVCGRELQKSKSIEAGNIFSLGAKYSEPLGAFFTDKNGVKTPIIMGCYGLGISRLMGIIVEINNDKNGIIWPKSVAPFACHLLPILSGKQEQDKEILEKANKVYNDLQNKGIGVLYDDRNKKSAGEKFADADLIGIPLRIVVSQKTIEKGGIEIKERGSEKVEIVSEIKGLTPVK